MSKAEYEAHRAVLIAYLGEKVKIADWHGVSDCCNDLRVLEAEWSGRQSAEAERKGAVMASCPRCGSGNTRGGTASKIRYRWCIACEYDWLVVDNEGIK
jgi:transposase-like protein